MNAYQSTVEEVLKQLRVTTKEGLKNNQVTERKKQQGDNTIPKAKTQTPLKLAFERFKDPLVAILLIAAGISLAVGEVGDAVIIGLTILIDTTLTLVQLWRTEQTLQKLREQMSVTATVIRQGSDHKIPARDLVIGDIVKLEAGDKIPADARVISATGVRVNESALTGESSEVEKITTKLPSRVPVGDQKNMLFMGTTLVGGSVVAVVTSIGTKTEIGKIAQVLKTSKAPKTPLRIKLEKTGIKIGIGIMLAILLLSVAQIIMSGLSASVFSEVARTAITLAVSAIPEDLTIILTVALAIGVRRILRARGLVRELASGETLGAATVICTDKTGTLTTGEMRATQFDFLQGVVIDENNPSHTPIYTNALLALSLNSDAHEVDGKLAGVATEKAALLFSRYFGVNRQKAVKHWRLIDKIPFSSKYKFKASLYDHPHKNTRTIFVTGAPDVLIKKSTQTLDESGQYCDLTPEKRQAIQEKISAYASDGDRLLAVAIKTNADHKKITVGDVQKLAFLGVLSIKDPLRPEAVKAIQESTAAGVAVKMITGDHPATARSIARQLSLPAGPDSVITGTDLETMSDEDLINRLDTTSIFARVTPIDKQRLVRALQAQGHVVAMTGDGVNDSVALKSADIGVAMGSGKDIAKEASKLILLDDNFATIVAAIREGRVIRDNLRKVIAFLLSTNAAEVGIFFASFLLRLPLPLLPAQILWVNIVTDGTSDLALSLEKEEGDVMARPPESPNAPLLSAKIVFNDILIPGALMMIACTILYVVIFGRSGQLDYSRTMTFTFLSMTSLLSVWSYRSLSKPLWKGSMWQNRWIMGSATASLVMHLVAIYTPFGNRFFETVPLTANDWAIILISAIVTVVVMDMRKNVFSRNQVW